MIQENEWPRQHFKNDPRAAAESLAKDNRAFLLAHSKGRKPAVPDNVWHGKDSWVLEHDGRGWRIGVFAREVMTVLAKEKSA
jgi:hypothetical protein